MSGTATRERERVPRTRVALGLGSNLGASHALLCAALANLSRYLTELRVAPLYRSAPESPITQPPYLNTVVVGRTSLGPEDLLAVAKALEWRAGRRSAPRLSARPLDIDLLLYGERVISRRELRIPHPRLENRRFVLQPLADLCPRWRPAGGPTARELLAMLPAEPPIARVAWEEDAVH